jgi:uncharacterized Fe-S cluster-containing radical SAM superfamily protein
MLNTNEARIETCTYCNYACVFCPHSTSFKRKKEIMPYHIFEFILSKLKEQAPQITDITISGFGEAFLDPSIMKKIKIARNMGYNVHTLTNGSLLDESIIDELVRLGVDDIRISLHALSSDTYKWITRSSETCFYNVIRNINYIIKNKYKTRLVITSDIIDSNQFQPKYIIDRYKDVADLIEIWKPHNWVDAYDFRKDPIVKSTCGRPWNSPLQIQVDGTINMCCFDYNGKLLLGDFLRQSLNDIFTGKPFNELKKCHANEALNNSEYICSKCDQRMEQEDAIIYNSQFESRDRLNRTSTNYKKV